MKIFLTINKRKVQNYIIYTFIIFSLVSCIYLYFYETKYLPTFSNDKNNIYSNFDLDGDGLVDKLEILKESNKYIVNIHSQNNVYTLTSSDGNKYLGDINSSFSIKVNLIDLSRDNIPEIIVRTIQNSKPVNYIFTFNNDNFNNILKSEDNLFGLLDSNNNRSPAIYSLASRKGDSSALCYMLIDNKLKDVSKGKTKIPGLSLIQEFIDFIEYPYELDNAPDIFSSNISKSEVSILWELNKNNNIYNFQSGYFYDYKWNKSGEFDGLILELSFNKVDRKNSSSLEKELVFYLTIEYDSYKNLKITSIKK